MLRSLRRLRTPPVVRGLCVATAAAATAVLVLSARWSASVSYTTSRFTTLQLSVGAGLIELWWHNRQFSEDMAVDGEPLAPAPGWAAAVERRWTDEVSLAWRPYHTGASRLPRASDYHAVTFPVWLLAAPMLAAAGYAHGVVVGARRSGGHGCPGCGYPRLGLARATPCPECGHPAPTTA